MQFTRATKTRSKLRLALIGPAGSGKTYSALAIAAGLGERIAVMDTERGSASLYADLFDFDVLEPDSFSPQTYVDVIHAAEKAGYDVLVVDSLSHAWAGKDGALEMVDRAAARTSSKSSFAAWREVTPHHNAMVDALIGANLHLIATLRSKTEYVQEKDSRGKTVIRKVGLQPVQRDGLEYEFTVVGDIDTDHRLVVTKTRCPLLADAVIEKPGAELAETLRQWLTDGAPDPREGVRERIYALLSELADPRLSLDEATSRAVAKASRLADDPVSPLAKLRSAAEYLEGLEVEPSEPGTAPENEPETPDGELGLEGGRQVAPSAQSEGY